jgi:hypothetical protein
MKITQRQFAWWFGIPVPTLRHWERRNRGPAGPALVLLHVIEDNPRAVRLAVIKARQKFPGSLGKLEPRLSYRHPPGFAEPRGRPKRLHLHGG